MKRVLEDAKANGLCGKVKKIDCKDSCPDGSYKINVRVGNVTCTDRFGNKSPFPGMDYHFVRVDCGGGLSDKPGGGPARRLPNPGGLDIEDPNLVPPLPYPPYRGARPGTRCTLSYNESCGCFCMPNGGMPVGPKPKP